MLEEDQLQFQLRNQLYHTSQFIPASLSRYAPEAFRKETKMDWKTILPSCKRKVNLFFTFPKFPVVVFHYCVNFTTPTPPSNPRYYFYITLIVGKYYCELFSHITYIPCNLQYNGRSILLYMG